jgi:hypothetical protein
VITTLPDHDRVIHISLGESLHAIVYFIIAMIASMHIPMRSQRIGSDKELREVLRELDG